MEFPYKAKRTPQGTINVYYETALICVLPPDFPEEHIKLLCHVHLEGMATGERAMLIQQREIRRAAREAMAEQGAANAA